MVPQRRVELDGVWGAIGEYDAATRGVFIQARRLGKCMAATDFLYGWSIALLCMMRLVVGIAVGEYGEQSWQGALPLVLVAVCRTLLVG